MEKSKPSLFQNLFRWKGIEFAAIYFLLFIVYVILSTHGGHPGDLSWWKLWAEYILDNGLQKIYRCSCDYLPGIHYILYLFEKFEGSDLNIEKNIYQLKFFILPFDFLAGFYLIQMVKDKFQSRSAVFIYSLFFFLNVFYLYNTIVWGQVDAIFTVFIFMSVYYALKEKVLFSMISALVALNFKLQAIVFVPLIGLLLIPLFIRQFSLKKVLTWIIVPLFVQLVILIPFLLNHDLDKIWNIINGSVGRYPVIAMGAFNGWYWVEKTDMVQTTDEKLFFGISLKHWGLFLFFVSSAAALFPLLINIIKRRRHISMDSVLLIASLIPLIFFFFNTQMHERYSHPAIIFIATWSIRSRKFLPYILVSVAYFLNMEGVLQGFQWNYHTLIFDPRFIAALYFVVITILYVELYKEYFFKGDKVSEEKISLSD